MTHDMAYLDECFIGPEKNMNSVIVWSVPYMTKDPVGEKC